MEKKVSKVTVNGQTLMDIHEDSVSAENLLQNETAHGSDGEPIVGTAEFGGDTTDCYKITDPASSAIDDSDYFPFHDVSDDETPKKKTLFSTIIDKLKDTFLTKTNFKPEGIGGGYCVGSVSGSAITATIENFVLTKGGIVVMKLDVVMPANATLNITNTGAKTILWYTSNGVRTRDIPAITNATWTLVYDGAYWRIISINKTPSISNDNYVADTSGSIVLQNGYDQNQFDLKYKLNTDKLYWNRYINGAWHGDVDLIDAESDLIIKTNQFVNTAVSDINNIPLNTAGNIKLAASLSPIGVETNFGYICYGGGTFKVVELTRVNHTKFTEEYWKNSYNGTTWTGWLPLSRTGTYIGTCNSAAGERYKVATVDDDFSLKKGVRIGIKFANTNTYVATAAAPVTLNVNNTGDKQIYFSNTAAYEGTNVTAYGYANRYIYYIYDGTYWVWDGHGADNNTTYSAMSTAELTTGTAINSRVVRADYLKAGIEQIAESSDIDTANNTATFTSSDTTDANATSWTSVTKLDSGESHASIFAKMSQMFKNIRYLYKMLGTTDISAIGGGNVTGAIASLNSALTSKMLAVLTTDGTPNPALRLRIQYISDVRPSSAGFYNTGIESSFFISAVPSTPTSTGSNDVYIDWRVGGTDNKQIILRLYKADGSVWTDAITIGVRLIYFVW